MIELENGYVEFFKIDYCLNSGIPTMNLIITRKVDMLKIDDLFNRFHELLVRATEPAISLQSKMRITSLSAPCIGSGLMTFFTRCDRGQSESLKNGV